MKNWVLTFLLAFFALTGLSPARAQTATSFAELLSGKKFPQTLKLKEIPAEDWVRFSLAGEDAATDQAMMVFRNENNILGYYVTKGETISTEGVTYLVAYRASARVVLNAAVTLGYAPGTSPNELAVTPETALELSLINLQKATAITQIQPYDPKIALPKPPPPTNPSQYHLKQIGMAVTMYMQDYDETLPPMKDATKFAKAINVYVRNMAVFYNPANARLYVPNLILSGRRLATIPEPASFVMIYEDSPTADGTRGVVFVDGHTQRVSEAEWQRLKRASKIPG